MHACDLSDPSAIEQLAAVVLERRGNVDILVNSAGHSIRRSVELSYDRFHDYERTMQLNYFGAVRLILALLPAMQEQGSGHVVNISTAGVQARSPRFSAYTASKTALDAFTDCVAGELLDEGVRFTKVEMPLVRTPMIEPSKRDYRSVPSISAEQAADRVAEAIVYRPRRIGTAFSDMAGVLNLIVPGPMERLRNVGYRLTGDSRAARGAAGPSDLRDFEETNIETEGARMTGNGNGNRTFVIGVGHDEVREARDAGLGLPARWPRRPGRRRSRTPASPTTTIEQAYVGYCYGESTSGQRAVYELGLTGIPVVNVNNNCSTGSTALYLARQAVKGGLADCALALGFEKMEQGLARRELHRPRAARRSSHFDARSLELYEPQRRRPRRRCSATPGASTWRSTAPSPSTSPGSAGRTTSTRSTTRTRSSSTSTRSRRSRTRR